MASVKTADALVWYVSYGSNLDPTRLATYLAGGRPEGGRHTYLGARNAAAPSARRPCRIPHALYFAGESRTWGGGVAFLDHQRLDPAPTLGHAHLLTAEQFDDVAAQETGRDTLPVDLAEVRERGAVSLGAGRYDRIVWLGDHEGVAQLTFTSPEPAATVEPTAPRAAYLRRLVDGLRVAHGLHPDEAATYLVGHPGIAEHWTVDDVAALATTCSDNRSREAQPPKPRPAE